MKMNQLLRDIYRVMVLLSLVLVLWMVINEFTHYDALGFTGLWYELDLRIEGSFATWLESMSMFLCFLPAYAIVRFSPSNRLSPVSRIFFLGLTFTTIFLAADEMLSIHELVGEKMGNIAHLGEGTFLEGFAWVLVYSPIMIIGLILFFFALRDILQSFNTAIKRKLLRISLLIAVGIGALLVLEM